MALDPQAKVVLDFMIHAGRPELSTLSVEQARALTNSMIAPPGPEMASENRRIPGPAGALPIRAYRPQAPGPLGGLVYFHGGGFVLGGLDGHDAVCRELAARTPCVVVSVDYRLAPEHPFPAGVDDCYAATRWVSEQAESLGIDRKRLAVGGDSAGGNLATATARLAKERGGPPLVFQLLVYPATDMRSFDRESHIKNATGKFLTRASVIWFTDHYAPPGTDRSDPLVSPVTAKDLGGLPPTLVITAEYDPLCDEGEAYAHALEAASNRVTLTRYAGMIHGFFSMYPYIEQGGKALDQSAAALRNAFASQA